jgi:pyruvate dehydrogenase E1 component beta subunit
MKLRSPTLIVEHHGFYGEKGLVPDGPPDHSVAIGKAIVRHEGKDVTVLSYGGAVRLAQQAAIELAREGVSAEIIDLRTVDDASMDYETIGRSFRKTGALVTVEEAQRCNSIGPKLVRECETRWFDCLDSPAVCVNAPDIPLPVSRKLEKFCLPTVETVVEAIRAAAKRQL